MQWKRQSNKIPKTLEELQKIMIDNRGFTADELKQFLSPLEPKDITLESVGFNLLEFKKAIKQIKSAIKENKKIVIFGDYDADGICASAILWQTLFKLYKKTNPKDKNFPVPFIPLRDKHGYGISIVAIDEIIEKHKPDLIITVDNGIVAHDPVNYVREKGINIIVTDHHQPETEKTEDGDADTGIDSLARNKKLKLPNANHVIHSTKLCGATVAWMIARELDAVSSDSSLDLAGIATIADQVPLTEANRSFAKYGVLALKTTKRPGIVALLETSKTKQLDITEGNVGFSIAPRINAMGRLDHGLEALRLLCTNNMGMARELASTLNNTNFHRQELTKDMLAEAKTQVETIMDEHMIIVYSETFHEGILGLIAGQLMEKFYKPAIAISLGDSMAKASARSIHGVNIVDILREIRSDLTAVGGHPMAAGFGFEISKLETIKKRLFKLAKERIKKEDLVKSIQSECLLPTSLVNINTVEKIEEFAPFGMRNPQPIFELENLNILEMRTIGKDQTHIKFKLGDEDELTFDAIGWRMSDLANTLEIGQKVSLVGTLGINEWNNRKFVQVILKDIKSKED